MANVKVYQYDFYDSLLKCERRSIEFATADHIMAKRGTILAESVREVDEDLLDDEGVITARNLPPRGEFTRTPSIARARGDDPRLGPT